MLNFLTKKNVSNNVDFENFLFNFGLLIFQYDLPDNLLEFTAVDFCRKIDDPKPQSNGKETHSVDGLSRGVLYRHLSLVISNMRKFNKNTSNVRLKSISELIKLIHLDKESVMDLSFYSPAVAIRMDAHMYLLKFAVETCPDVEFVSELIENLNLDENVILRRKICDVSHKDIIFALGLIAHVFVYGGKNDICNMGYSVDRDILTAIVGCTETVPTFYYIRDFVNQRKSLIDSTIPFEASLNDVADFVEPHLNQSELKIYCGHYKMKAESWIKCFRDFFVYHNLAYSCLFILEEGYEAAVQKAWNLRSSSQIWYPILFNRDIPNYFNFPSPQLFSFLLNCLIMIQLGATPTLQGDLCLQMIVHILYYSTYVLCNTQVQHEDDFWVDLLVPHRKFSLAVTTWIDYNFGRYCIVSVIMDNFLASGGSLSDIFPEMPTFQLPEPGTAHEYMQRLLRAMCYILDKDELRLTDFTNPRRATTSRKSNTVQIKEIFKDLSARRKKALQQVTKEISPARRRTYRTDLECIFCHEFGGTPNNELCYMYYIQPYNVLGCTRVEGSISLSKIMSEQIEEMYRYYPPHYVNIAINLAGCDGVLTNSCEHVIHKKCLLRLMTNSGKLYCPVCSMRFNWTHTVYEIETMRNRRSYSPITEETVRNSLKNSHRGTCDDSMTKRQILLQFFEIILLQLTDKQFPVSFPNSLLTVSCILNSVIRQILENKLMKIKSKVEFLDHMRPLGSFINLWHYIGDVQRTFYIIDHIIEFYDALTVKDYKLSFPFHAADPISLLIVFSLSLPMQVLKDSFFIITKVCFRLALFQDAVLREYRIFDQNTKQRCENAHHFIDLAGILYRFLYGNEFPPEFNDIMEQHNSGIFSLETINDVFSIFPNDLTQAKNSEAFVKFSEISAKPDPSLIDIPSHLPELIEILSYNDEVIYSMCLICGSVFTDLDLHLNNCCRGRGLVIYKDLLLYKVMNYRLYEIGGVYFDAYGVLYSDYFLDSELFWIDESIMEDLDEAWKLGLTFPYERTLIQF